MTAPLRQAISELGPRDGSAWTPPLATAAFEELGSTPMVLFAVPPITKNTVSGKAIQTALPADNVMYNLSQILIVAESDHVLHEATSVVTINVYRAGAIVGGGKIAGWADGAAPAITGFVPTNIPFDTANTILRPIDANTPVSATQALVPLQPGDVIAATGLIPTDFATTFILDGH